MHLDCPEQARFHLFDSITTFLKTASQRQPLVLVLDGEMGRVELPGQRPARLWRMQCGR